MHFNELIITLIRIDFSNNGRATEMSTKIRLKQYKFRRIRL